ncbi:MAG: hypothetical protein ABIL09_07795 [Gemmatimonadota bacterium]
MSDGNWHLFIDNAHVARATGLDRVIHHPRPRGVVLAPDRPWETVGVSPQYVGRRDDGTFEAFYTAMWWDTEGGRRQAGSFGQDRAHHMFQGMAYAESSDGLSWHKPELGLVAAPTGVDRGRAAPFPAPTGSGKANNLGVPFAIVADLQRFGDVTDPARRLALRLVADPAAEQKVGASWEESPRGYFAAGVPDFLGDPAWREGLQDSGGSFDPRRHLLHFWDRIHQEWVAMEQGVVPHWLPTREVGRFASRDLVRWTSEAVLYPDPEDAHQPQRYDEPMSLTPFCGEGLVFGLLSWFHSDRDHPDAGPRLEPTPQHPARWPWCRKGTNEMRLTVSRDGGRTWDRTSSRAAWVPHGTEHDSYDRLVIGGVPPVRVGDEDWFYLSVIDGDHLGIRNDAGQTPYHADRLPRHQIALYTQKHNRYVSLRASHRREVLVTHPLVFDGGVLELNADAARGRVRVGVAAAGPVPTFGGSTPAAAPHLLPDHLLPGFGFDDCQAVRENSAARPVSWGEPGAATALRGRQVVLLFEMEDADLYGYRLGAGG